MAQDTPIYVLLPTHAVLLGHCVVPTFASFAIWPLSVGMFLSIGSTITSPVPLSRYASILIVITIVMTYMQSFWEWQHGHTVRSGSRSEGGQTEINYDGYHPDIWLYSSRVCAGTCLLMIGIFNIVYLNEKGCQAVLGTDDASDKDCVHWKRVGPAIVTVAAFWIWSVISTAIITLRDGVPPREGVEGENAA